MLVMPVMLVLVMLALEISVMLVLVMREPVLVMLVLVRLLPVMLVPVMLALVMLVLVMLVLVMPVMIVLVRSCHLGPLLFCVARRNPRIYKNKHFDPTASRLQDRWARRSEHRVVVGPNASRLWNTAAVPMAFFPFGTPGISRS